MAYSENKNSNRRFSSCTCSYFYSQFYKNKFGINTEDTKNAEVKEEPVKIIELRNTVVKKRKLETLKELSNKLDYIEQKADEVYEKVNKKKKDKKKKKKNN